MHQVRASKAKPYHEPGARRESQPRPAPVTERDKWMALQRGIGNQAVSRMFQRRMTPSAPVATSSASATLRINEPGDAFEHEADRVSAQVTQMPATAHAPGSAPLAISGQPATSNEGAKLRIKSAGGASAGPRLAPASVHTALSSPGQPLDASSRAFFEPFLGRDFSGVRVHVGGYAERSARDINDRSKATQPPTVAVKNVVAERGQPLDAGARAEMEARFQYSFAHVRVHADAQAAASAQALNARAYTLGQRIVFGPNRYAPSTDEGRWLLAHELAHTIQQRNAGDVRGSAEPDEILESSANAAACSVASGATVSFRLPASDRRVQRAPVSDLHWKNDVKAARYRGQLMAARIRQHGKLSSEARAKANEELAYFEGAAKEAYIREVKPALAPFVEIQMPAMAMGAEPAKPEPISKQREYEAMAAYYELTRQSQLEAAATAHTSFREGIAKMSATEIYSQWDAEKEEFIAVALSPTHTLKREQLLQIWSRYWSDRYKVSQTALMHITDLKPDERSAAQERAEKEEELANFMIRSVVLANEYLIAAEDQGKHVTLDELNKAAAELETFHEHGAAASGMIVPGGLRMGGRPRLEEPVRPPVEVKEPFTGGGGGATEPPTGNRGGSPSRPPAQTTKASPPPPPQQTSRPGAPTPVTDVQVVKTNVDLPASIKIQSPSSHQTDWTVRGGTGKAPAAYRDSEGILHISADHPLMGDPNRGGIPPVRPAGGTPPARTPSRTQPAPSSTPTRSGSDIGLEDTGKAPAPAKPAVDPGAKPAAPKDAPVPKDAPTGGAAAESKRGQAPRGQIDPPQAVSGEVVENIRNRPRTVDPRRKGSGSNVHYTTDHEAHELAWKRLGGHGDLPPAFIYNNQVYLDPSRWKD